MSDAPLHAVETATKHKLRAALSDWNWGAIAAGVVVALASQILLLWLGNAFALSVGDEQPAGGFAIWVIVVQLGSLFLGAAFAGYLARTSSIFSGAAVGAFTWALALVLGSALATQPLAGWRPQDVSAAAWTTFFGAILSLITAMLGGALGSRSVRRIVDEPTPYERPIATQEHIAPTRLSP